MSLPSLQQTIHSLEQGGLGFIIRGALLLTGLVIATLVYLFMNLKGIGTAEGMDQAQIARELARGNGYSTRFIRPATVPIIENQTGSIPTESFPEVYHAPLNPIVLSWGLGFAKDDWATPPKDAVKDLVFPQDRVVAFTSMLFFFGALAFTFFFASLLFDQRLAFIATGLTLVTDMFWQFSMSGLPQMLMMFLFSGGAYFIAKGMVAQEDGKSSLLWSLIAAVFFGLLGVAHPATLLITLPVIIFVAIVMRPAGLGAAMIAVAVVAFLVPYCMHNFKHTGSIAGLAYTAISNGATGSQETQMRTYEAGIEARGGIQAYLRKIQRGIESQFNNLFLLFGANLVAPVFFLALLHPFKRRETSNFRWLLLLGWVGAFLATALLGMSVREQDVVHANHFQVIVMPLMIVYGSAFLLVLWSRLGQDWEVLRGGFIAVLFALCGFAFFINLLPMGKGMRIHYPPYHPFIIAQVGGSEGWMREDELVTSDIPWAVAWYADRDTIWLPTTLDAFYQINDFEHLGRPIRGMFLSPASADRPLLSGIIRGPYQEWLPLITRSGAPPGFPLTAALPIPVVDRRAADIIFLADRTRWEDDTAEALAVEEEAPEPGTVLPLEEPRSGRDTQPGL
ncbi:MAG: ArnT family glycosyltransferase [Verrucomicrobiales bacterium]